MKTKPKSFAARLSEARESAGLTQVEAAARTGYSVSAIQKFEGGKRMPPRRAMAPILDALQTATKP